MEKGKRLEAELQLPEAIIQHIQSFLTGKEAAQTTLLSKPWYAAWLTRPDLDFDQKAFARKSDIDTQRCANRFWEFVKKTVGRYEKFNLQIDSLRLRIHGSSKKYSCSKVNELIMKALKMGATCLDLSLFFHDRAFTLPHEVFGSENLIRLSVSNCKIGIGADGKVSCSRLKSLTLDNVRAEGDIIWDIISSCPLIENLSLSPSSYPFTGFVDGPIILHEFCKLKRLSLNRVDVHPSYLGDFSSKFPCLKDLGIHRCYGFKVIQISSHSLECINFTQDRMLLLRVKFDVPNLRRFTFSGLSIPSLSFATSTTTTTWVSHISIKRQSPPGARWFLDLNKLLKELSPSTISLSLLILAQKSLDNKGKIPSLTKPIVKNLTINGLYSVCPVLFYDLFQCCRPIYINSKSYIGEKKNNDYMEFVNKRMMLQVSLNSCIAYQRLSGGSDLKEVSVLFYDKSVSAWRPQLLDTSTSVGADEHRTRLRLRWKH
ncbi:hypothetical protein ACS0TY_014459 [Phlomoides rotata]